MIRKFATACVLPSLVLIAMILRGRSRSRPTNPSPAPA